jgi:hypothetical protein
VKIIGFKTNYATGKEPMDYVEITSDAALTETGAFSHTTWLPISTLIPPDIEDENKADKIAFMKKRWALIEPAYKAWKEGTVIPLNGVPLGAWPGITADQANALRLFHILTVEAVRDTPEAVIPKIPLPNYRGLMVQAAAYLDGRGTADLAAKNVELTDKIAAMQAALEELMGEKMEKRGPGRPRKEVEAA